MNHPSLRNKHEWQRSPNFQWKCKIARLLWNHIARRPANSIGSSYKTLDEAGELMMKGGVIDVHDWQTEVCITKESHGKFPGINFYGGLWLADRFTASRSGVSCRTRCQLAWIVIMILFFIIHNLSFSNRAFGQQVRLEHGCTFPITPTLNTNYPCVTSLCAVYSQIWAFEFQTTQGFRNLGKWPNKWIKGERLVFFTTLSCPS